MRTLHIDMPSGVAGDMLLASLVACGADLEAIRRGLAGLGVGPIGIVAETVMVGGLSATHITVDAPQDATWMVEAPRIALPTGALRQTAPTAPATRAATDAVHAGADHQHRPYRAIRDLIGRATLPERVRTRAQRCFRLLAEAEAAVHGVDPETVHFHEVGGIDAIADVVGCCLALESLGIDAVVASPLTPGHGTVRCAHGLMPVPVPAVAELLRRSGAPCRTLERETGELTTPTGAALVCGLADRYLRADGGPGGRIGTVIATGFGAGTKRIPGLVNAVRCVVTEDRPRTADPVPGSGDPVAARYADTAPAEGPSPAAPAQVTETICELRATIDDATGEALAVAIERLLAAGALDAWLEQVVMKKGRPGVVLVVLGRIDDRQHLADAILSETPSIGVRWSLWQRAVLPRSTTEITVGGHRIALKVVTRPGGRIDAKPEADAVAAAAAALGRPFSAVQAEALAAWRDKRAQP
jgi:uncharacterized protein (TIGR00299 family) protein